MNRYFKRLTIKKRAQKLGGELRDQCGPIFTGTPSQNNTCRTLIRLQRIKCGLPPFAYSGEGFLEDVYVTDLALRAYGNLKREQQP